MLLFFDAEKAAVAGGFLFKQLSKKGRVNANPLYGHTILMVEDEALITLDLADATTESGACGVVTSSVKGALAHVEQGAFGAALFA